MGERAEFLNDLRATVERLFAHRKMLRTAGVRIGFWPEGLVISVHPKLEGEEFSSLMNASREVIPWEQLAAIDRTGLLAVVDRACQPSHDLLKAKGTA